jgi:hypothetical protein
MRCGALPLPGFLAAWAVSLALSSMPLQAARVIRGPYLQSAAADRMTVCWRTDDETTSELRYGLATDTLSAPVVRSGTRIDHAITLIGLQPATRYYYRVQGTPGTGGVVDVGGTGYWFKTAPAPGTSVPVRIWALGDSGYDNSDSVNSFAAYQNITTVQGKATDVFMMLGDNAYTTGTDDRYQHAVFNRYAPLLKNTPLWAAFGNHDSYTATGPNYTGPVPYDSIFRSPTAGECGGVASGAGRYYSFDHGNVHFICLDTNTPGNYDDVPGGTPGMVDWLQADLENCSADWIIAYMHQGPYSKGSHDSDTEWNLKNTRLYVVPLLENHGADLVLCGHSHSYERSGLNDGHYGLSPTWNPATMRKWPGNGSDLGGVDGAGSFVSGNSLAGGIYQKPAAIARTGTVYAVNGASSLLGPWWGGSLATVNPTPHPAHQVSLRVVGGMTIDIEGNRMKIQYLDVAGAVRDDFTILKGATYTLQPAAPTTEGSLSGVTFPVTRTGSTAFAEQVPVAVDLISGSGVTPTQATAQFAAGQSSTEVKFFPKGSDSETHFEARLLPTTRSVQTGAAPRAAYRISGGPQVGYFGPTDPMSAVTWYSSRFGAAPSGPAVWEPDDDGDGLSLLLEYALGGEPGRNDSALLPQGKVEAGSFIYSYTRPPGRSDLSYEILGSENLSSWPLPGLSDVNDGPVTALGEPRRVELPAGSALRFVRMKIGLQP